MRTKAYCVHQPQGSLSLCHYGEVSHSSQLALRPLEKQLTEALKGLIQFAEVQLLISPQRAMRTETFQSSSVTQINVRSDLLFI